MSVRRINVLAVTTVVALVWAVAPAAAKAPVSSEVTMSIHGAKFKGKVTSSAADCVVGRKVLIKRKDGPNTTTVGKTFASESGKYSVTIPMQGGNTLYAKINRYKTPMGTVCKGDRSPSAVA